MYGMYGMYGAHGVYGMYGMYGVYGMYGMYCMFQCCLFILDSLFLVQVMACPPAIDVSANCACANAIAAMDLTTDQFKWDGPAEWLTLVRSQYKQLATQYHPDKIHPLSRSDPPCSNPN